uniref:Uncharacterized protein n=1 Tax=Cacopsylla melanoneura TaxID=428564 RepID=A0A8D8PUX4_9HEMI
MLVLALVQTTGIIFLLQSLPVGSSLAHHMVDNFVTRLTLLLVAFGTTAGQGVGDCFFQFSSLIGAGSLIHQTLDVIGQNSVIAEDLINIKVIVFVCVRSFSWGTGCYGNTE